MCRNEECTCRTMFCILWVTKIIPLPNLQNYKMDRYTAHVTGNIPTTLITGRRRYYTLARASMSLVTNTYNFQSLWCSFVHPGDSSEGPSYRQGWW